MTPDQRQQRREARYNFALAIIGLLIIIWEILKYMFFGMLILGTAFIVIRLLWDLIVGLI